MVARSMPPKAMAKRLVRLLRPQRPDYPYLKKVFQHTRELLQIKPRKAQKRLPELLTDEELVAFYETVWHGRHPTHMVMVKLLLFTGVRNAELAHVQLKDVDLNPCQLRIEQGKGKKTAMCNDLQLKTRKPAIRTMARIREMNTLICAPCRVY